MITKEVIRHYVKEGLSEKQAYGRLFLREMSQFIWNKYAGHLFIDEEIPINKIQEELRAYEISDIWYNEKTGIVTIKLNRPGVLIGVRGYNLSQIENHFRAYAKNNDLNFDCIKIIEDKYPIKDDIMSCIISYSYATSREFL